MGMLNSFQRQERPIYYYKLNENYNGPLPAMFEGINLTKVWTGFDRKQDRLNHYLRTYRNVNGILDLKIEDMNKKQYTNTETDYTKQRILYTRDVLCTYRRKNLEEIARNWGLETKNKRDPFLIDEIVKEQEKYSEFQENAKKEKVKKKEKILAVLDNNL